MMSLLVTITGRCVVEILCVYCDGKINKLCDVGVREGDTTPLYSSLSSSGFSAHQHTCDCAFRH